MARAWSLIILISGNVVQPGMTTKKHAQTSHKRDYRIFVGAFPEGPLIDQIQALRVKHDPKTAAITAPHITIAGTYWRTGLATPESELKTIEALLAARAELHPFTLNLGGIQSFGHRVIYLGVEATPDLLAIRRTLQMTMG